jgi:hypothetical protein
MMSTIISNNKSGWLSSNAAKEHRQIPIYNQTIFSNLTSFKSCRIQSEKFSDEDATELAGYLKETTTYPGECVAPIPLRLLDVCHCPELTSTGVSTIVEALKYTNISNLKLTGVPIRKEGLEALSSLLSSPRSIVHTLGLNNNKLGELDDDDTNSAWNSFLNGAIGPNNTNLKSLDLYCNQLSTDHILDIANALKSDTVLENLIVSDNMIGDDGVMWLCDALNTNTRLKTLSIASCRLSNQSLDTLLHTLKQNTTLERIYSYSNDFTDTRLSQEVDYWLGMNRNGRADIWSETFRSEDIPNLVVKSSRDSVLLCDRPDRVYGLLREVPHLWSTAPPSK